MVKGPVQRHFSSFFLTDNKVQIYLRNINITDFNIGFRNETLYLKFVNLQMTTF